MKCCKEKLGVAEMMRMVVCALHLTITFLVLSFKKRSIWQAILLLASTGLTMATLLMPEEKLEASVAAHKKKKPAPGEDDEAAELEEMMQPSDEVFTEEECACAAEQIRETLSGGGLGETAAAPSARREIPRDEEASEADFQ